MADFQAQLQQYRKNKQREAAFSNFKLRLRKFWMLGTGANATEGRSETAIDIKVCFVEVFVVHTCI